MKTRNLKKVALIAVAVVTIAATATSCSKTAPSNPGPVNTNPGGTNPGGTNPGGTNPGGTNPGDTDLHVVDARLVGTWMWTDVSDGAWYGDDGTYHGPESGLALQYTIAANGDGSAYNHLYSSIGGGTSLEVNIASTGFFESDNEGHFGYFPLSGTYESTGALGGEDRNLDTTEVWNPSKNTGKCYLYQQLVFKNVGGRDCFEVTSADGITDRYYKVQ